MTVSATYRACYLAVLAAGVALYAACNPAWVSYYLPLVQRNKSQAPDEDGRDTDSDTDLEVPGKYLDPITHEVIEDPVILCATGMVYGYTSLKQWFLHGGTCCPKTNQEVLDVQIMRVPWLRTEIEEWLVKHGRSPPQLPHSIASLTELNPQLAEHVRIIRSGPEPQRHQALAQLVRGLRVWALSADTAAARTQQQQFREAIVDDMTWLMRYGDVYSQGVAASVAACCKEYEELHWLALTGTVPLTALLLSTGSYGQEWSLLALYDICLAVREAHPLMWRAGTCQALLSLISKPAEVVNFHRDRAAVILAHLAAQELPKRWIKKHGVVALVAMMRTSQDRWEQRDAAFCLLALGLGSEALAAHQLTLQGLQDLRWCSQQWLDRRVSAPQDGLTPQEVQARHDYERQMARYRAQRARQRRQHAAGGVPAAGDAAGGGEAAAAAADAGAAGADVGGGAAAVEAGQVLDGAADAEGGDAAAAAGGEQQQQEPLPDDDVEWGSDEAEDEWALEDEEEEGEDEEEEADEAEQEDEAAAHANQGGHDDSADDGPDLATDHLDSDDSSHHGPVPDTPASGGGGSDSASDPSAAAAAPGPSGGGASDSTTSSSGSSNSNSRSNGTANSSGRTGNQACSSEAPAAAAAVADRVAAPSNDSCSLGAAAAEGSRQEQGVVDRQQQMCRSPRPRPQQHTDRGADHDRPTLQQQQQQQQDCSAGEERAGDIMDQAWPVSSLVKQLQQLQQRQQQRQQQPASGLERQQQQQQPQADDQQQQQPDQQPLQLLP